MNYNPFCNNRCRTASLNIRKINGLTGVGIPGAVFELASNNGTMLRGVTDSCGLLCFPLLPCRAYMLTETGAPAGYMPIDHVYNIVIDACGLILVDGVCTCQLVISNTPIMATFTAIKVNAVTGERLAGAGYALYQNSVQIGSTVSDAAGHVTFSGLAPGVYQLMETTPPAGFEPNPVSMTVEVAQDGSVTINGQPANGFVLENTPVNGISAPPVINTVVEGATVITGTGVPGSAIAVTLPNGPTVNTTVAADGTWSVAVPVGVDLVAGQVVSAVQTETGKQPSSPASTTVVPVVEAFLEKTLENVTSPGDPIEPGDEIEFTILIGNVGGAGSVWTNAVLSDFLINDLTFIPGSVTIDGTSIPEGIGAGHYSYDDGTRTLIIYVGDIGSGVIQAVTYHATLSADAAGDVLENSITAMSVINDEAVATATSPTIIIGG